jgi:hypothetical protein
VINRRNRYDIEVLVVRIYHVYFYDQVLYIVL